MDKEMELKNIRNRILERLDSPKIEYDGDVVSFYDLYNACIKEFEPYTSCFKDLINEYGTKLNKKSKLESFFGKKTLFVSYVVPEVVDNNVRVDIYLHNSNNENCGVVRIENEKTPILIGVDNSLLQSKNNIVFINDLQTMFSPFLRLLSVFRDTFNGINYSWNLQKPNKYSLLDVDDGFMHGRVDLNNLNASYVTLSNLNDIILSTTKEKKFGASYDYIEFYKEAFMKRLPVRLDELNPLFKTIMEKHLDIKKLTMEK